MSWRERVSPGLRSKSSLLRVGAAVALSFLAVGCAVAERKGGDIGVVVSEDPHHKVVGPNGTSIEEYFMVVNFRNLGMTRFAAQNSIAFYDEQFNPGDCVRFAFSKKVLFPFWQRSQPAYEEAEAKLRSFQQKGMHSLDHQGNGVWDEKVSYTIEKRASVECDKPS